MAKDFTFKQFHISAYQCGMPVSTDAILLGAWANISTAANILDIGSGTGLLAIMCAQRNAIAKITAIEIEQNAYNAAVENTANTPWAERLTVKHTSIQHYVNLLEHCNTYDAIICNPPYFNNGLTSSNAQRAIARHTASLSHCDLLIYCEQLLKEQGTASFVLPKAEGSHFIDLMLNINTTGPSKLIVTRLVYVKTTADKLATRLLVEITKQSSPAVSSASTFQNVIATENDPFKCTNSNNEISVGKDATVWGTKCESTELIIHDGHGYSREFIDLTQAFYLKM
jgi:tRNA1Val (adenine37-N6)-methyltransferase